jgi:hypothetical protein
VPKPARGRREIRSYPRRTRPQHDPSPFADAGMVHTRLSVTLNGAAAVARLASRSGCAGFRLPPDVITLAVRWYLRYGLSYRDVEELPAERASPSIT